MSTREYEEFDHEYATTTANRKRGSAMASSMLLEDMEAPAGSNVVESSSSKMLPSCRFALLSKNKSSFKNTRQFYFIQRFLAILMLN